MKSHRRRQLVLRWCWTLAAALIVAGWLSTRWCATVLALGHQTIGVSEGGISFSSYARDRWSAAPGLQVVRNPAPLRWKWQPIVRRRPESTFIWIPLWIPLFAAAGLAAISWLGALRGALRIRKGRCPCGYDRRGLSQATPCPECGTPERQVP